jgi:hypothetical protein
MAELGNGPQRTADIAAHANRIASALGTVRNGLITKGLIELARI